MGIKYAHKYTYSIKNLSIDNIFSIACDRLKQKRNEGVCYRTIPSIDIDSSWIIRGFGRGDIECRIRTLINIALCFVASGFHVNLICDGAIRHHSKRATIKRQSDTQKKRLQLILIKSELMLLSNQRRTTDSIEERNIIQQQETDIQKKIRSLEKELQRMSVGLGEEFIMKLKEGVNTLTASNRIAVHTALFQADSVMAYNIINNTTDILLTSDSDQAAILGAACVSIKNFKIVDQQKKRN
jgi:hypothetical protein